MASGADLVLFSGDKLLGGPQAGCLVGRRDSIAACRRNPFARALRADKMTLAALEATLALYDDEETARREVPVLRMLTEELGSIEARARRLMALVPARFEAQVLGLANLRWVVGHSLLPCCPPRSSPSRREKSARTGWHCDCASEIRR